MTLVLDLDGTLISSTERCTRLFCELARVSYAEYSTVYLNSKARGLSNSEILSRSKLLPAESFLEFNRLWMEAVESPELLKLDTLEPGVTEWLRQASSETDLVMCTSRQSSHLALKQVADFGISNFFTAVLVTEQKMSKAEAVINSGLRYTPEDWMIGDSPEDIEQGKKLGMNTCSVLSGFRDEATLAAYGPDLVVSGVCSLTVRSGKISLI